MNVPQIDLTREYSIFEEKLKDAVLKVMESGRYILGPSVKELEEKIASYTGVKFAKGVASGSDALLLSLMAINLKQNEGVITTPFTFFATASAGYRLGGIPIFVDIDKDTYNISPSAIEQLLEDGKIEEDGTLIKHKNKEIKVRAIIPVHLFGQSAEMDKIMDIAKKYNLYVIEDAAQSIGAEFNGKRVCTFGDMGIYSFFPTKNLGTYGDGGMVVTNDEKLDHMVKILRVHGAERKYHHTYVGINSRLDEIHAAILLIKFELIDEFTKRRIKRAYYYFELFEKNNLLEDVQLPKVHKKTTRHVWNQFVIKAERRDELKEFLNKNGIGTNIYYPIGLHMQKCFESLGYKKGELPITEKLCQEVLALPMHPFLRNDEQEYVVEKIREFYHAL